MKTITFYTATTKIWGSDWHNYHYFETIKERNAFVKTHDYADIAAPVKVTERQYQNWKEFGELDEF